VPVVREVYGRLPTNHSRVGALRLLATIATREAEQAILDLVVSHRGEDGQPGIWFAWGSGGQPRHVDVFFPEILGFLDDPEQRWGVLALLTKAHSQGLLAATDLSSWCEPLLAATREIRRRLKRRQRPEPGPWCWSDSYAGDAGDAAALLDLLGRCGGAAAVKELRIVLRFTDPYLRAWAAASLVRLGEHVDQDEIQALAERDEARRIVARALQETGRLDELPEELRSQEAFARAEMFDWLTFPTELDGPPGALELEAVVDTHDGGTLYVFRFENESEWYAGIAGPYPAAGPPAIDGGGMTFSDFTRWDERTPAEHVAAIVGGLPD
jgi:hypothetical protein